MSRKKVASAKWILGNEEDAASIWSLGLWTPALIFDLQKRVGKPIPHFFVFEGWHMRWFIEERQADCFTLYIVNRLRKNPKYFSDLYRYVFLTARRLQNYSQSIRRLNWKKLTDDQLADVFIKHEKLVRNVLGWGFAQAAADVPTPHLTNYLTSLLDSIVVKRGLSTSAPEYFNQLTAVVQTNIQRQEHEDLCKLAVRYKKLSASEQRKATAIHCEKYSWAYFGYTGPVLKQAKVRREVNALLRSPSDLKTELRRLKNESRIVSAQQRRAIRELRLKTREIQLFQSVRDGVRSKICRRDAISESFYMMQPALKELARRGRTSQKNIQNIFAGEPSLLLSGEKKIRLELERRKKFCVIDSTTSVINVLSGPTARRFFSSNYQPPTVKKVKELYGQSACLGGARGIVRIINVPADLKKMKQGDILVSIATTPDIVSGMKKAAAIVTEQGGITSHAAIVSRELGTPCVIGTKIATRVLRDGDKVEVDANKGVVRIVA